VGGRLLGGWVFVCWVDKRIPLVLAVASICLPCLPSLCLPTLLACLCPPLACSREVVRWLADHLQTAAFVVYEQVGGWVLTV
jgi:hypothetical protein